MLQKVSIQNFKSLKDVTLELQKVNLLIGPNNSGKSNFLKALDFKNTILSKNDKKYIRPFQSMIFEKKYTNTFEITLLLKDELKREKIRISGMSDGLTTFYGEGFNEHFKSFESIDEFQNDLKNIYNNINIYKPDPNKLQKPFPILPNQSFVNSDASNLVAFLDILQGRYRDSFVSIENDLNKCIPEFSRIELDPV